MDENEKIKQIKVADLLPGFETYKNGNRNPVYIGFVQPTDSEAPVNVYFKVLPARDVFVESICSLLANYLGLPTPEPYLINLNEDCCPPNANLEIPAFGTSDCGIPSYKHFLNGSASNLPELLEILKKWKKFNASVTFDEFIVNTDRNIGNLIFDGKEKMMLIDHGSSISKYHPPEQPNPSNMLISYLDKDSELTRRRHRNLCEKELHNYVGIPFSLLAAKSLAIDYLDDKTINEVIKFLVQRTDYITENIANQFKTVIRQQSLR
jgi:hypothetical protein